jgi:hypothetical protein
VDRGSTEANTRIDIDPDDDKLAA